MAVQGGEHLDANCPLLKKNGGSLEAASTGRGALGRSQDDEASLAIFNGQSEVTLPLEAISASPEQLIASLTEHGRSLATFQQTSESTLDSAERRLYVLQAGEETDASGVVYGELEGEILPMLCAHWPEKSRKSIISMLARVPSSAVAVDACNSCGIDPIFHGPAAFQGLRSSILRQLVHA